METPFSKFVDGTSSNKTKKALALIAAGALSLMYGSFSYTLTDAKDVNPGTSSVAFSNWANLATFFAYPADIRKVIYTTNAIESLNSVIRHAIKKRKVFPTDDAVKKVVWLAIQAASQKWTMPLRDWRMAMSRFIIEFGDRLDGHF